MQGRGAFEAHTGRDGKIAQEERRGREMKETRGSRKRKKKETRGERKTTVSYCNLA